MFSNFYGLLLAVVMLAPVSKIWADDLMPKHGQGEAPSPDGPATARDESCEEMLPIGNTRVVLHGDSVQSAAFSPDGKYIVTASWDHTAKIAEVSSGKVIATIPHSAQVNSAAFSPDGKYVITASSDRTAKIAAVSSGKVIATIARFYPLSEAAFSPDGKYIITVSSEGTAQIAEVPGGKVIATILHSDLIYSAAFSPDGKYVVTASVDHTAKISEAPSGRVVATILHSERVYGAVFSPDGKYIATASSDHRAKIAEVPSGEVIATIRHSDRISSAVFSPDGKYIATASWDGIAKIAEVPSGKVIKTICHSPHLMVNSVAFSPDGKYIATASSDHSAMITEVPSGRVIAVIPHSSSVATAVFSSDGKYVATTSDDSTAKIVGQKYSCRRSGIYDVNLASDFSLKANSVKLAAYPEVLCQGLNLSKAKWDEFVDPSLSKNGISLETAYKLLYRFQKPDGFDPVEHTNVLLSLLQSPLVEKEPGMIAGVLENVLMSSNQLYNYILNKYPKLLTTLSTFKPDPKEKLCRNDEDKKRISGVVQNESMQHMVELTSQGSIYLRSLNDMSWFYPLKRALSTMNKNQKDEVIHSMTTYLRDAAADGSEFHGVFGSKLYYFVEEAIEKSLFQTTTDKDKEFSDITFVRGSTYLSPYIFGTAPIDGDPSTLSQYGFYAKRLTFVPIDTLRDGFQKEISFHTSWSAGADKYDSKFSIKPSDARELVTKSASPPYEELKKDGVLEGLVVPGTNLFKDSKSTMEEFKSYYEDSGFHFNEDPENIEDLPKYVSERIKSGQSGYFLKEAHSDGDEKNIFRMDLKAKIFVGEKKDAQGKTIERVLLVYPSAEGGTKQISNAEFGSWVRARKNPVVFFNTSCWSTTKASDTFFACLLYLMVRVTFHRY